MTAPVDGDTTVATGRAGAESLGEADLPLSAANVHWGYFSKELEPVLTVTSGQEVVVEMATHHACDDWDRMIAGDPGKLLRASEMNCDLSRQSSD